ncbi:H-NS histone family protein (plasmid) [Tabrizicola sp. M-4]
MRQPSAPTKVTRTRALASAQYANPADRSETWSGRGRKPRSFSDALAADAAPESFLVWIPSGGSIKASEAWPRSFHFWSRVDQPRNWAQPCLLSLVVSLLLCLTT